ncbi:MAG TPA: hypothetical protein VEC16_04005 [Alphaproteobacteria bacterium]|nr:hypothetical protein [Alphaproteobacteria bacterium]
MRIQEHIYQGFFGLKKKKDAKQYYNERVDKLKGLDSDLDEIIDCFQSIMNNHNAKLKAYNDFLRKPTASGFAQVRSEIEKLEGMFDPDELANNKGQKYVLKNIDKLKDLTDNEESAEMQQLEQESLSDLNELLRLLKSIEPVWQEQIDFVKRYNDSQIVTQPDNLRKLSNIFIEESKILNMEESLLRRIDLKTGTILRKTTLKQRDIQKTDDMDMRYREVKYVR